MTAIIPEGPETDLGGGIFAQRQGQQVAVILPERLWATTDDKLVNVLRLNLPKVYGQGFWESVTTASEAPEVEPRGESSVLRYTTRLNERVYINPVKDSEKGIYGFSTWVER